MLKHQKRANGGTFFTEEQLHTLIDILNKEINKHDAEKEKIMNLAYPVWLELKYAEKIKESDDERSILH